MQMVQLSDTKCSCIAILLVSLVSFTAITLCVASQGVFIDVYFVITLSGNFWMHPRISLHMAEIMLKHIGEILKQKVMCDCVRVVGDTSVYLSTFAVASTKSVNPQ